MKGSRNRLERIGAATVLALAFVAGAIVTFGIAALLGAAMPASLLAKREPIAAAALIVLALFDIAAIPRKSHCALGLSRQTPKTFAYRFGAIATAAAWGFDTGLAVTTFRVAAMTWAALLLVLLGFASWSTGLAYGVAFAVPLVVLLFRELGSGRIAALVRWRGLVQAGSAITLFTAALLI